MGNDVACAVTIIRHVLEDFCAEARNLSATQAPDQFLRFAGKHRPGDDFNVPVRRQAQQ
jgi:hypothetical protein